MQTEMFLFHDDYSGMNVNIREIEKIILSETINGL